jgi:hypothetical protein
VHHRRTMMAALVLAGAATFSGIGVASSAEAATTVVSSPAQADAWYIKKVYSTSAACRAAGEAYVSTGWAKDYKCLYDSPGIALWLNSY